MSGIPAASLHGVSLEVIRERYPVEGAEIDRIGKLMLGGKDTDAEFLQLCQLLFHVGEVVKSEELLRANANEGDERHALYLRLHGMAAQNAFREAIATFSKQFGVDLVEASNPGYLNTIYCSTPRELPSNLSEKLRSTLSTEAEVEFRYCGAKEIVADAFGKTTNTDASVPAQPLIFRDGMWVEVQ